jgi:predicted secreted acid phosphatase
VTRTVTPALSRPSIVALLSCLLVLAGLGVNANSPAAAALPSKSKWVSDTYKAMEGSRAYTEKRVANRGNRKLAVNLDIDNTSLASHYDYGKAVAVTLRFAKHAKAHGVAVLYNTGRERGDGRLLKAYDLLKKAGFPVTQMCGRKHGEGLTHGKQRCRRHFVDEGYTLISNVGNRSTDFTGTNYSRAFRLPNYHNQLA